MGAEDYGKVLLRVADQLCQELGCVDAEVDPERRTTLAPGSVTSHVLDPEDSALPARLKTALGRIAIALSGAPEGSTVRPAQAALEGVESVVQGELVRGTGARLPQLMPSFVFLVALSIVDQDRALELSRRTSELIKEELGG